MKMAKNLAKEQNAMSAASVFKAIDNVLKKYEPALPRRLRWSEWAYPLDAEGKPSAYWTVDPAKIDRETFDLSVVTPNIEEEKLPSAAECKAILKEAFE